MQAQRVVTDLGVTDMKLATTTAQAAEWLEQGSTSAGLLESGSGPHAAPESDLAELRNKARSALADARSAAQQLREVIDWATELMEAGTNAAESPEGIRAADELSTCCQSLVDLSACLAHKSRELHQAAGRLSPPARRRYAALISMLQAQKHAHADLVARAEQMLAHGHPIPAREVVAASECTLGRWWLNAEPDQWCDLEAYLVVDRAHRLLHRALAGLVFAVPQGRQADAEASMAQMQVAQRELAAAVDTLVGCAREKWAQDAGLLELAR
jgi:hypothetical protein